MQECQEQSFDKFRHAKKMIGVGDICNVFVENMGGHKARTVHVCNVFVENMGGHIVCN